jgi:hypothetical protein
MSAAMLASAERTIAKLTLVFLLRSGRLLGRRVGGSGGGSRSHFNSAATNILVKLLKATKDSTGL